MKTRIPVWIAWSLTGAALADGVADNYTNFIRQVQYPSRFEVDVDVSGNGQRFSQLPIDPGGARFELWTLRSNPFGEFLLDSKLVGAYIPIVDLSITTEDPYTTIPRTRADRPFTVEITTSGLLPNDPDAPEAAKKFEFLRHVQSYGLGGTGVGINRDLATQLSMTYVEGNGFNELNYTLTSVPGADRAKVAGEERFTAFSIEDYQAPASQLASKFVQIWPVADGSISGIEDDEALRFSNPNITITANDLYPDSRTYAQIYKGAPALGTVGTVIPGSGVIHYDSVPLSRVLVIDDWGALVNENGQWTIELLTATPFGIDRLDFVTFTVNRTIEVNGAVTTVE